MSSLMKKFAAHKVLFALLLLGFFVLYGAPVSAHAGVVGTALDLVSVFNPYTWGAKLMSVVTYAISFFLTACISVAGLLLNLILVFSGTLIQSPIIKTGFSITLALMNLGLVIAALFMAVATIAEPILGNDTYTIKKRLPVLILVAVFANFLLLGAGTVIKFSDGASFYFASQASPGTGGAASYGAFATKLVGAFNPATLYDTRDLSILDKLSNIAGSLSDPLQSTLNLLFVTVFELFIFIVILLAALMMLIRYVYLGVLLIIAPLALLTSLFPSLSSHWKSWCTKFLHWTMFGPIMMLFLYLTILAAQTRDQYINPISVQVVGGSTSATTALNKQVGRGVGFFVNMAEMVMLLGIAGAGVMAANSFAPKFAQSAMNGAGNLGKKARGYLGSQAKTRAARIATSPLATRGAQDRFANWQGSSNIAKRWAGRTLEGIGIGGQRAGEERAKKNIAGRSASQINNNWSTMNDGEKIAALERLRQEANLGLIDQGKLETDLPRLKGIMERQGKSELFEQVNKESGTELRAAMSSLGAAKISGEKAAIDAANARLMEATNGVDIDKMAGTLFPSAEKLKNMQLSEFDLRLLKAKQRQFMQNMMMSEDADNMGDVFKRISRNGQMKQFKALLGDELGENGAVMAKGIRERVESGDIKVSDEFRQWSIESPAMRTFGLKAENFGVVKNTAGARTAATPGSGTGGSAGSTPPPPAPEPATSTPPSAAEPEPEFETVGAGTNARTL